MFCPFPKLLAFHNVRRTVAQDRQLASGPMVYRAKVKLHGTNAGVQIRSSGIFAQSRTHVVGTGNDNLQFSAWVDWHNAYFQSLITDTDFVIFGEWCGPEIMEKTALTMLPHNIFVVFMLQYGPSDDADTSVITEPDEIRTVLGTPPADLFILDWHGPPLIIDFVGQSGIVTMEQSVTMMNAMVEEVERLDPWAFANFGISGTGEGLVFYPRSCHPLHRFSNLVFKAKGEKHRVIKSKHAVTLDPERVASVLEFIQLVVTEPRLRQGVAEACHGKIDKRLIGPFLEWVVSDVKKETKDELEAADLEWNDVKKGVQYAARNWFETEGKNNG